MWVLFHVQYIQSKLHYNIMKYYFCSTHFYADLSEADKSTTDTPDILGDKPQSLYDKDFDGHCILCESEEEAKKYLANARRQGDNAAYIDYKEE